jgi:outer membrane protein
MIKSSVRAAVIGLALLSASAPAVAQAQAATPTAILVVDVNRVFAESAAGQDANRQLKAQGDALQARFNQLKTQFGTEEEALRKQQGQIAQEALQQRVNDLVTRQNKANEEIGGKRQALERALQAANQQILSSLRPIIETLMAERSAQMVLDRQVTLNIAPSLDVTTVVIQRLNAKLPKVSVAVPPAPAAAARPK